eukprot:SAG11_NODE_3901_length_2156_cov_7.851312_4_plen_65_part_01
MVLVAAEQNEDALEHASAELTGDLRVHATWWRRPIPGWNRPACRAGFDGQRELVLAAVAQDGHLF